ncbi:hypothetical protein ILUMI_23306 [Ignelater luminosus]|uniref:Uncharacterized protein n=1 Tax=Ignelater luminosus TaxID=2038154 RepID=A0A8K0G1Y5_IGNLU|nr:hypothetical protein ILUMI_23306 [Ignelater luminosus]
MISKQKKKREMLQWHSHRNFIMALICWTVGLGNCWRFPVAASLDGGGAFLLPYLLETFVIAIPFTYMELGLGQFSNRGPVAVWALCPIWKGVGNASITLMLFLMVYYNIICSYLIFFFFASMSTVVPWSVCDPSWAKPNCFTFEDNSSIRLNCTEKYGADFCNNQHWENSAVQYWKTKVLDRVATEGKLGRIRWEIVYCSSTTATLVFLLNCKGTKSLEKVVPFFSIFPYLELIALLFVSLIDPGSSRGIRSFMMPDFVKLWTSSPWRVAFEQILFSIGLGLGGLTTLGSHCHFRNPIHVEAIAINLIDIASSLCYGIMIFNCLGALSYDLNIPMEEVMAWPDTLLFAKIPLSLNYLPGIPQLWGVLFYSSIYIIGLRSQGLMMATVLSTIYDHYPRMLKYTFQCSAVCSLLIVVLGYPFLTQAGSILLNYVDNIIVGPTLLMVCFLETAGVICIYGMTHFTDDMHFMLGFRASMYWQLLWSLSPLFLGGMFIHSVYNFTTSEADRPTLMWMRAMQWLIFSIPFLLLIIGITTHVIKKRKKLKVIQLFHPSPNWGPRDPILKKSREMFTAHSMTKEYMYRQNRMKNKIKIQNQQYDEFE